MTEISIAQTLNSYTLIIAILQYIWVEVSFGAYIITAFVKVHELLKLKQ